jgi:hypothetical protein
MVLKEKGYFWLWHDTLDPFGAMNVQGEGKPHKGSPFSVPLAHLLGLLVCTGAVLPCHPAISVAHFANVWATTYRGA